jgi:uncharacterized protein YuzE
VNVELDRRANALYVALADRPVAYTRSLRDGRVIDYAEDDSVVGIEFLGVSAGINLSALPQQGPIERAIAAYNAGVPGDLRVSIRAAS